MDLIRKTALPLVLFAAVAGCRSNNGLFPSPGTIEQQRYNATMFDPYTDIGMAPEVVGGRPREFQNPLPESERTRMVESSRYSIQ